MQSLHARCTVVNSEDRGVQWGVRGMGAGGRLGGVQALGTMSPGPAAGSWLVVPEHFSHGNAWKTCIQNAFLQAMRNKELGEGGQGGGGGPGGSGRRACCRLLAYLCGTSQS